MASGHSDGSIVIDTALDNDGFEKGADKLLNAMDGLTKRIEVFGSEMRQAFAGITNLLQNLTTATRGAGSSADTGAQQATQAADTAQQAAQAQTQAAQQSAKAQTQAATKIVQAQGSTSNSIKYTTRDIEKFDKQLSRLENKIELAKVALVDYYKAVNDAKDSSYADLALVTTDDQANNVLEVLATILGNIEKEYAKELTILKQLESEYAKVTQARNAAVAALEARRITNFSDALRQLSIRYRENLTDEKNLEAAAKRITSALFKAAGAAKNFTKRMLKLPFKAVATSAKLAVSSLKSFAKQAKKTGFSADGLVKSLTSLKTMLVSRIKRMFISTIFQNVSEGLKQLALFDSKFNDTMSEMKNSVTQLSGNIAATVGNIVTALEPVITTIISLFNKAVTAINQFFAVLNGKTTYTAAKKGTQQFAEATEEAAEAQEKLNAELYSFDELNRQSRQDDTSSSADADESAIQYEELPVNLPSSIRQWIEDLKAAWKSADWYGVGEVMAEGLNSTLKTVDDWINGTFRPKATEWAKRAAEILNGLFDKVDWPLLGKTVADGLNAIADICNTFFTTFKAKNFGSGIGATIKGWFDNIDWPLIGQTFANGWNTILHIIEGIVTTPGIWASIGQSIGQFVKSWFTNIDLNSIATSLIAAFNGVATLIKSFLDQNPFEGVAEKIYTAVNRVLHEVNWAALGQAIGNLFITVLKNLVTVVQQIDWVQLGRAVGEALAGIDWLGVFAQAAQFIGAALWAMLESLGGIIKGNGLGILVAGFTYLTGKLTVGLAGAIFKQPLQQALTSIIADLLKNVIGSDGIGAWGPKILAAGKTLLTTIVGKIGSIATTVLPAIGATLTKIVTGIVSAIGGWPTVIIAAAAAVITALVIWIKNGGGEVIQGFIDGVKEKWEAVKQALKDFADLWITGFKSLFGIHSPSTVMAEQGGFLMDGLLQGVSDKWPSITEFLSEGASELGETLSKAWQEMTSNAKENWENLKSNVTGAFENAKTKVQDTATQIKSNLSSKWSEIRTNAQSAWDNVKSAVSNAFNNARNSVNTTASNMRSNLSSTFSGIVSNAQTAWSNLQTTTNSKFSSLQQNVMNAWQNLRNNLNNVKWDNIGHNLVAGLNNGVSGAWGGFMSNVSTMVNNLISRIKSLFGIHSPSKVFAEIGEFLDAGLEQGMENGEKGLLTTASNIATAVTEGMTPDTPNVQMNVDSVVGSMQAIISSLGSLAVTFQTIANALTSIGGFTLPNIAAGTVVPYQTKVAANAAPAGTEGGVEAYLLGILSELQALSRSMRNGDGTQPQAISISIGGHEVFNVVVDENNRAIMRNGKSPLKTT